MSIGYFLFDFSTVLKAVVATIVLVMMVTVIHDEGTSILLVVSWTRLDGLHKR